MRLVEGKIMLTKIRDAGTNHRGVKEDIQYIKKLQSSEFTDALVQERREML